MGRKARNLRTAGALAALGLLALPAFGQSPDAPRLARELAADRASAVEEMRQRNAEIRAEARARAAERGWPVEGVLPDGRRFELRALAPDGMPLYDAELTSIASEMSNALAAHAAPWEAQGDGITIGVWDSGVVNIGHQEFDDGGVSRVRAMDGSAVSAHGTAVAGVAVAVGINPEVRGAAPRARVDSWRWTNDLADAAGAAASKPLDEGFLRVSNHSYGTITGWAGTEWRGSGWLPDGTGRREDSKFGRYGPLAAEWDAIAHAFPYFLTFWAAGNDRNDVYTGPRDGTGSFTYWDPSINNWNSALWTEETAPFDDNFKDGGYNTVIIRASAKNVVTVGAVDDAIDANGVRNPAIAVSGEYSSWGPTDDGRIKPDVVANGTRLRVTVAGGPDAYGTGAATGTSFSAPSAAGVAALVAGYAADNHAPWRPRASTLKALLIHGATDIGNPGPDYQFGWGLVDAVESLRAVAALGDAGLRNAWPIVEARLANTSAAPQVDEYEVHWDGEGPLVVTLVWTDPPAPAVGDVLNDPTPVLVNDLDLRLFGPGGAIAMPFILDPANPSMPATTGDNFRDPVEQVRVEPGAADAGTWTIRVSHKAPLAFGEQWYSLVATGQSPAAAQPLAIHGVEPRAVAAGRTATLRAAADNALPGTRMLLRQGAAEWELAAPRAGVREAFADLDTAGFDPGAYDVVLVRPDGDEAVLAEGLLIVNDLPQQWILR